MNQDLLIQESQEGPDVGDIDCMHTDRPALALLATTVTTAGVPAWGRRWPLTDQPSSWASLLSGCCGVADTQHHRAWICPYASHIRSELFTEEQIYKASITHDFKHDQAWLPPLPVFHKHDVEIFAYFNGGQRVTAEVFVGFTATNGEIFVDGWCFDSIHPNISTAGAAAVQVDEDGHVVAAIWVSIPVDLPQNAAVGEHLAILLASVHARDPCVVVTDCQGVFSGGPSGPLVFLVSSQGVRGHVEAASHD